MNIGHSSKLIYDKNAYLTKTEMMTEPMKYKLSKDRIYNKNQAFTSFGPRTSYMGNNVSTIIGHPAATSQYLTDIDSVFTNRNVLISKARTSQVNPINPTKFKQIHLKDDTTKFLDPITTRLTNPAFNYKEAPIDRFYNLNQNPQNNIFWNFSVNTDLEMKDNFRFRFKGFKQH